MEVDSDDMYDYSKHFPVTLTIRSNVKKGQPLLLS